MDRNSFFTEKFNEIIEERVSDELANYTNEEPLKRVIIYHSKLTSYYETYIYVLNKNENLSISKIQLEAKLEMTKFWIDTLENQFPVLKEDRIE